MLQTRRIRAVSVAVSCSLALMLAMGGVTHAAPRSGSFAGSSDAPQYITCQTQISVTVASSSVGLPGGGILHAYLYRQEDWQNHTIICGWEAYASGTSGSMVTASLYYLCTGSPRVCQGSSIPASVEPARRPQERTATPHKCRSTQQQSRAVLQPARAAPNDTL